MRTGTPTSICRSAAGLPAATLLGLVLLLSACGRGETGDAPAATVTAAASGSRRPQPPPTLAELAAQAPVQRALLDRYCSDCHNLDDFSGGLAFELLNPDDLPADAEVWEDVIRKLRGSMMPPPGQPRPSADEAATFVAWLEGTLDLQHAAPMPGDKRLQRLNRTEYANAVRDLLQLQIDPAALLPVDGAEDGFDNIASALQVTPTFVDQYLDAARVVSMQALGNPRAGASGTTYSFSPAGQAFHVDGLPPGSRGGAVVEHLFPSDGEYRLNIGSLANGLAPTGLDHASTLVATLDGRRFFETRIGGPEAARQLDQQRAPAIDALNAGLRDIPFTTTAGPHHVAVFFLQRSFAESDSPLQQQTPRKGQDAVAGLGSFEIYGPVATTGLSATPSRRKILSCTPGQDGGARACAGQIIARLGNEAFRGRLDAADTARLLQLYEAGEASGGFETGIAFALSGILAHPKFLFRAEPQPAGLPPATAYELGSLELASRLAFFLWSSLPDAPLLAAAADEGLRDPAVLQAQVLRMLQDARARNLADNFAWQWLGLGELENLAPDSVLFRDVDRNIRSLLTQETLLFVQSLFEADRSVVDLLTADHSYLNENLALHYGINDIRGSQFRRVQLQDERRWGLLGKGAVLMVSSYPNRTSPVLRGKWLLEKIMGTPPAAPPPEVEGFVEIEVGQEFSTVRERLETHRANPSCNGCHGVIDPLGFALENFDATGRWQDLDRMARTPIDASGVMADGTPVDGPLALRNAILARPELFVQSFTEKLMTFALGRGLTYRDMPAVRRIVREAAQDDYRLSTLVSLIVASEQFRMRSTPAAVATTVAHAMTHEE